MYIKNKSIPHILQEYIFKNTYKANTLDRKN